MIPFIGCAYSSQIGRDRKQNSVCQGMAVGQTEELAFNGYGVSVWEDEESSGDEWW